MLEDEDEIAKNLLAKLSEYAMGREMNYADSEMLQRLLEASKKNDYKLRATYNHSSLKLLKDVEASLNRHNSFLFPSHIQKVLQASSWQSHPRLQALVSSSLQCH